MTKKHITLPWVRWETDAHRDGDLLELPACQRWLWPVLLGLGGKGSPPGTVRYTDSQLAKEADLSLEDVTAALERMCEWGKVRRIDRGVVVVKFKKHNPPLRMLSHGQRGQSATE